MFDLFPPSIRFSPPSLQDGDDGDNTTDNTTQSLQHHITASRLDTTRHVSRLAQQPTPAKKTSHGVDEMRASMCIHYMSKLYCD